MMVVFTIPKAFTEEHIDMIQQQAIWSWTELACEPRIVLCGDDPGVNRIAKAYDCIHMANVETMEGIPVVSNVFNRAQEMYPDEILLYVNCDIIILDNLIEAIFRVADELDEFLVIGNRYNWSKPERIDPVQGWQIGLAMMAMANGWMDPPVCTDYFAFPSGLIQNMPPFLIGRYAWDTWIVSHCYIERDVPTIDISPVATAVHQDHSRHRHPRNAPLSLRNIAMITRDDMRTGGRSDFVPYILTKEGIERRESAR